MASQPEAYPRFSFGKTVSDMFGVIGRNFLLLCGLALLIYGVPMALFMGMFFDGLTSVFPDLTSQAGQSFNFNWLDMFGPAVLVSALLATIFAIYAQCTMIWAALGDLQNEPPTFMGSIAGGARFFFPVLGITLVYYIMLGGIIGLPVLLIFSIGFAGGLVALLILAIIPAALFVLVAFLVAVPAAIAERCGVFNALSRSWALTSGHRWKLFAMVIIYSVVSMMISSAISGAMMPFTMSASVDAGSPFAGMMPLMVIQTFLGALMLVITYPALTATYFNLRRSKEGFGSDDIADIFE